MSVISFTALAKSYGPDDVFRRLDGALPRGARIALVGPNGSGKTTLLKIMAGLEPASEGEVFRARGLRFGYLPQESVGVSDLTVWEEMLSAFGDLRQLEAALATLELAMADPAERDAALAKYGPLQEQFERLGGYTYETEIKRTLSGLGFAAEDYDSPLPQLSGGQKTRALLARLLLERPDLLLLDEPTNHLDIAAVEWLERWLREWHGTALLVSHDRYFLDQTVSAVWELHFDRLETYRGNYSAYVRQRAERLARQAKEHAAQQAYVRKEQEYIRRNIAGQNTRQAQGRRRRLERLLQQAHENDRLIARPVAQPKLNLDLAPDLRSGDRVLETKQLAVGYQDDGQILFRAPDLLLLRGEIAALIGPNGAGKTTFLKTLLGEIPPLAGQVKLGASLRVGYFAQAHEGLHAERTLIDEIQAVQGLPEGQVRNYLAQFLFTGDDVFKRVDMLSGGERGRLALAKLALEGANFLLLDEPTNHLDIPAQETLEAVLSDFPGTILLVSHDRYLIDRLATQIWALEEGRLTVFAGGYSEYVAERADAQPAQTGGAATDPGGQVPQPGAARRSAARRRAQRATELEADIERLEQRLAELDRELTAAAMAQAVDRVHVLGLEYEQVQAALADRLADWEAASSGQHDDR